MNEIRDEISQVFGNKKNIKESEDNVQLNSQVKTFFINNLSMYNADQVGYLRWAITSPTGRQALYFKKNQSRLEYDNEGELISSVWYNLYLENREHYLTERVWLYMLDNGKNKKREHFIINFYDDKGITPATKEDDPQAIIFTLSSNFLSVLNKNGKIRERLLQKEKSDALSLRTEILPIVREIRTGQEVLNLQKEGINKALELWVVDRTLCRELNKCFNLFYMKRTNEEESSELIPISKHKLASQFLFMFQNIAIFCPEVKLVHLFSYSYISAKRKRKSAFVFFFKEIGNRHNLFTCSNKLFDLLTNIESAVRIKKIKKEYPDTVSFPLWSSAFSRLQKKEIKKKN
jgi:hypothetical protein